MFIVDSTVDTVQYADAHHIMIGISINVTQAMVQVNHRFTQKRPNTFRILTRSTMQRQNRVRLSVSSSWALESQQNLVRFEIYSGT